MGQPDEIATSWAEQIEGSFETGQQVTYSSPFLTPDGMVDLFYRIVPEK